ncbi:Unknown protein sequence [Pseudomonas savastanoi pv. glycinea]|nr:Unknown protein sequence [Pseudomonas savastanoi pv. glycinea]KPC22900.1 Unknown protein sequence [Pseudomonas savastanoi pv. glycinea]KPC46305.1 Unknown protein sequence [Pseudomonas savastanoi pv. glycinea]
MGDLISSQKIRPSKEDDKVKRFAVLTKLGFKIHEIEHVSPPEYR